MARKPDLFRALIAALAAAVSFALFLGRPDWNTREVRHAEIAREMWAETHDYLVPHRNGKIYHDKPPVPYWLMALVFEAAGGHGGPSLGLARLPSAFAGIVCVLATLGIGAALLGGRAGLFAALFLAGTPGFAIMARNTRPDMVLVCFVTVACLAAARAAARPGEGRLAPLLFGLATGLAVLTKGPLGLVIPFGFAIALRGLEGAGPLRGRAAWRLAALGLALPVAAWLVPILFRPDGPSYLRGLFTQEDLVKGAPGHERPFYHYLLTFPGSIAPTLPFFALAVSDAVRRRARAGAPFAMVAALFLLFSAIPGKRGYYLLPIYPFSALLAAAAADRRWNAHRLWRWAAVLAAAAPPIVFGIVYGYVLPRLDPPDRDRLFALEVRRAIPPGAPAATVEQSRLSDETSFVLERSVLALEDLDAATAWLGATPEGCLVARVMDRPKIEAALGRPIDTLVEEAERDPAGTPLLPKQRRAVYRARAP